MIKNRWLRNYTPTQYWDVLLDHNNLIKGETKLIMKSNF